VTLLPPSHRLLLDHDMLLKDSKRAFGCIRTLKDARHIRKEASKHFSIVQVRASPPGHAALFFTNLSLDYKTTSERARLENLKFSRGAPQPQHQRTNNEHPRPLRKPTGKSFCTTISDLYSYPSTAPPRTRFDDVSYRVHPNIDLDSNRMSTYTTEGLDLATPAEPIPMPIPCSSNHEPHYAASVPISDPASSSNSSDTIPRAFLPGRRQSHMPIVEELDEEEVSAPHQPACFLLSNRGALPAGY
jgi:hypothetical protein